MAEGRLRLSRNRALWLQVEADMTLAGRMRRLAYQGAPAIGCPFVFESHGDDVGLEPSDALHRFLEIN